MESRAASTFIHLSLVRCRELGHRGRPPGEDKEDDIETDVQRVRVPAPVTPVTPWR